MFSALRTASTTVRYQRRRRLDGCTRAHGQTHARERALKPCFGRATWPSTMQAMSSAQCTQMSRYTHMRCFADVWAGRTWPANERCRTSPRNVSISSHDPHNNDPGEKPRSSQSTSPLPAAASAAATKLLPPQHTSAAAAAAVATAANTPRACPGRLPRARRIAPRTPQRSGANGAALLALLASPTPVCPACAVWRAQERRWAAARARRTLCLDRPPHAQVRAGAFDPRSKKLARG